LIVPFAPGGGADLVARVVGQKMGGSLGQMIVVENRAGAAGRVGAELVAKAPPDGYVLLLNVSGIAIFAPAMYPTLPYDTFKDYTHISVVASNAFVLVAHPAVPAHTVKELIALERRAPGRLNYASAGPASPSHLGAELFNFMAGTRMVHVPYKGSAPGTLSVVMGETDIMFSNILPALPALQQKRLRPLAITSAKRSALLPDLPTAAESGLKDFQLETLYGLSAPAGLPPEILRRLNDEAVAAVRSPDVVKRLLTDGSEVVGSTPAQFTALIRAEIPKWRKVIERAGIKGE
jgi:tripartite-type tricarboxylate transporter receptor subunit TctC